MTMISEVAYVRNFLVNFCPSLIPPKFEKARRGLRNTNMPRSDNIVQRMYNFLLHPHVFVFTTVCPLFRQQGVVALKPYILHKNTRKKAHLGMIWDVDYSPRNDYCRPQLCCLSCMLVTSIPPKIPLPGEFFGTCRTPAQKFGNFLRVYAPAHRFTSAISNMVEIGAG